MTTSLPVFDFSTSPEDRAKKEAEEQVKQLEASLKKDAPAVKAVKQGLVPTPKAAKTSPAKKRAGRVVGISADENKFLYDLLQTVLYDDNYAPMINDRQIAFDKLLARYNNK